MHTSQAAEPLFRSVQEGFRTRYQYYAHVAGMLLDVEAHRALRRTLRKPSLDALLRARPDLGRKYLWPCFARSFERGNRLELMRTHYQILSERASPEVVASLLERPTELWAHEHEGIHYSISLEYPPSRWDLEGELCLRFDRGTIPLYRLLLTLGEGAAIGRTDERFLLIGAVQGNNGKFDAIRTATKACADIAPRTLLLAATAGLAEALDIATILAVGNDRHITRHMTPADKFPFDYDHLWLEMGGVASDGFFSLSVPLPEKPIGMVTASHRRRALQRRASRERVAEHVRDRVEEIFRRA